MNPHRAENLLLVDTVLTTPLAHSSHLRNSYDGAMTMVSFVYIVCVCLIYESRIVLTWTVKANLPMLRVKTGTEGAIMTDGVCFIYSIWTIIATAQGELWKDTI